MENENNINKQIDNNQDDIRRKKIEDFLLNPDKTIFNSVEELKGAVDEVNQTFKNVDLSKLETIRGEDGKTPERGVDYFTPEDIDVFQKFIIDNMPEVDIDFPSVDNVNKYIDTKVLEMPRAKGDKGDAGVDGKDGKDGKDGSPDTPREVLQKIRLLGNNGLKVKDINGLPTKMTLLNNLSSDLEKLNDIVMNIPISIISGGGSDGGGAWGSITGTLSDQTDLQSVLDTKANLSGATFTGAISATNLSGTNTGDQDLSGYATLTGSETLTNKDLTATSNKLFKTGTISTASSTAAKTVTLDAPDNSYTPAAGDLFLFTYTSGQTASSATINVNGNGDKNVRLANVDANNIGHTITSGGSLLYRYDGTYFHLIGSQQQIDTTYTEISNVNIKNKTSSTVGLITGRRAETLMSNEASEVRTLTNKDLTSGTNTFPTFNQNTTGNAATATKLATARTIAGVSFDGSSNISLNNNAITNGAGYTTNTGDVTLSGTQTLTNKRIDNRVQTQTSTSTLTFDRNSYDTSFLTAQAGALTIANSSNTNVGDSWSINILDNGTARALTFGTDYVGDLPTTTITSKWMKIKFTKEASSKVLVEYYYDGRTSSTPSFKGCRIKQTTGQSIGTSLTVVNFDAETFDTDTMHDNSTNNSRITFTTAGYYQISGIVNTDGNAVSQIQIRLNGSTSIYKNGTGNAGSSTANGAVVSTLYQFSAGDYIEMLGAFGTTQNTKSGEDGTTFSVVKVG